MRKSRRLSAITLCALAVLATTIPRASAGDNPTTAPAGETRFYDIRDIIDRSLEREPTPVQFSTQQQGPLNTTSSNGLFTDTSRSSAPPSRDDVIRDLTNLIKTTVAPETWRDAGGTTGSIQERFGQLAIEQAPDVHAKIEKALSQLRAELDVQVQVEMRIYNVDQKTLDALSAIGPLLTTKQAEILLKPGAGAKVELVAAPRALMFSGARTTQLTRITQRNYVENYAHLGAAADPPVVQGGLTGAVVLHDVNAAAELKAPIDPVIATVAGGSVFRAAATVAADRSAVTIHVSQSTSTAAVVGEIPAAAHKDLPPIDKPATNTTSIEATFSLPVNMYCLLGGDRVHNPAAATQPATDPTFIVYLVSARIVPPPLVSKP